MTTEERLRALEKRIKALEKALREHGNYSLRGKFKKDKDVT